LILLIWKPQSCKDIFKIKAAIPSYFSALHFMRKPLASTVQKGPELFIHLLLFFFNYKNCFTQRDLKPAFLSSRFKLHNGKIFINQATLALFPHPHAFLCGVTWKVFGQYHNCARFKLLKRDRQWLIAAGFSQFVRAMAPAPHSLRAEKVHQQIDGAARNKLVQRR
jgi:hypothetical protein